MRRPSPSIICYALAITQLGMGVVGCHDSIGGRSGGGNASTISGILATQDIGAAIFSMYRQGIAGEPAGASRDARLAALDARRDDFVTAIDDVVNVRTLQGVGQT